MSIGIVSTSPGAMTLHKWMVVTVVLVVSREGILTSHKFNCLVLLFVGIYFLITLRMDRRFPKRSIFIMSRAMPHLLVVVAASVV